MGQRNQRRAFAYNASNIEGVCVFSGVASTLAKSSMRALFKAMVAAGITARGHGFHHLLFLIDSRNVVQVFKKEKVNRLANLNSLKF